MADFFFYGTLCHAPLLAAVVGRTVEIIPATLDGHAVYWADGRSFPMIVQEAGARADGVLARGLNAADVARLDYYEGGFAYDARPVMAEAAEGAVEARVYFPDTTQLTPGARWSLLDWQTQMGDVAVTAAGPFMRGFGVVPQEAARARYPAMLVTAAARLRAGMAAPTEVRRRASAMDTAVIAQGEAYAEYFSVEEYDLHFRRFDGEMSPPVRRAVWVSGDAATVLPYDPVRDRVALIEQFRAGPFARGDRQPWMLEPIAGRIDLGETPEAAARREAVEEAGLQLGALWKVGGY
ncbi:MAG: gamma-glutamylcyclotransferase [Paracoccaceae bacterium]|nr:gamma-glutamylcyclotransferase [Paracoccaceae bacterium]